MRAAGKRMTYRQWWHRLIHRKCWTCNVPLEHDVYRDGRTCPMCRRFYNETVMVRWESKIRADSWWRSNWSARG